MSHETRIAVRTVAWSEALSTGVAEIDAQHQELFRRVNRFLVAVGERRDLDELQGLLDFLGRYVHEHFAEELRMMKLSAYPGLGDHLAEHQLFAREFHLRSAELQASGPTAALARRLEHLLVDWLRDHVAGTDQAMGAWFARFIGGRRAGPSA